MLPNRPTNTARAPYGSELNECLWQPMKEGDQEIDFWVGVEPPVEIQPGRDLGISVLQGREISARTTWKETGRVVVDSYLRWRRIYILSVTTPMFEYVSGHSSPHLPHWHQQKGILLYIGDGMPFFNETRSSKYTIQLDWERRTEMGCHAMSGRSMWPWPDHELLRFSLVRFRVSLGSRAKHVAIS